MSRQTDQRLFVFAGALMLTGILPLAGIGIIAFTGKVIEALRPLVVLTALFWVPIPVLLVWTNHPNSSFPPRSFPPAR